MKRYFWLFLLLLFGLADVQATARHEAHDGVAPMRRPIDHLHPAWIIHIDCWNYPDPQKIIELVPDDIKPWVVFNIALSSSHSETTGAFTVSPDGYHICQSWLRVCAEHGVWAMIQPSSGGYNHFPEDDLTVYEEFYRLYPNFIGWNFAEQFWGYGWELGPTRRAATFDERMGLLTGLLQLAHRYGGYLVDSWCGVYYGAALGPVAMVRRYPAFRAQLLACPEHFIECEKFTSTYGFHDIESTCLGMWLSGYSGHYGQRFDQCGYGDDASYPTALGAMPMLSHVMLTGQDVVDGPELIWQQDFHEVAQTTEAGWTRRNWARFPQFDNIPLDLFRKVLDGSVRIMDRAEVIDRTKLVIVDNRTTGSDQEKYLSPLDLFIGLYQQEQSPATVMDQKTWTKTTGRYPAIPTVADLDADSLAATFEVKVNSTTYKVRWSSTTAKRNEFNRLFPKQYDGTAFADRVEHTWVIYNPSYTSRRATADLPTHYASVGAVHLNLAPYSTVLMHEAADSLHFYLTNYNTLTHPALATDTIRLDGVVGSPEATVSDRAHHVATQTSARMVGDTVWQLVVSHNGPVDVAVRCPGRWPKGQTPRSRVALTAPEAPPLYVDTLQREAESMDWRSVTQVVTNGTYGSVRDYYGQGYVNFGTTTGAALRDTVDVPVAGAWYFTMRYRAPEGKPTSVYVSLGGTKKALTLRKADEWTTVTTKLPTVKAGLNEFQIVRPVAGVNNFYVDCFTLAPDPSLLPMGVDVVEADEPAAASEAPACYDLFGRRLTQPLRHGLTVMDGQKVYVR